MIHKNRYPRSSQYGRNMDHVKQFVHKIRIDSNNYWLFLIAGLKTPHCIRKLAKKNSAMREAIFNTIKEFAMKEERESSRVKVLHLQTCPTFSFTRICVMHTKHST